MKNLKLFLVAGLLTVSAPAFAQFANTGNNSGNKRSSSSASAAVTEKTYSRIELSYNPISWDIDGDDDDTDDLTGISFGYVKGFSISKSMPLYVETGLRLTYAWWSDDEDGTEYKDTYMGLTIPVNLTYRFAIPNSKVLISPFVGLTLKGNIIGKSEADYEDGEDSEINWFDDKWEKGDEYDEDKDYGYGAKRFQIGWNIGANVSFNQFNVGLSYGSDFSELWEDTKTSNWAISVGYNF